MKPDSVPPEFDFVLSRLEPGITVIEAGAGTGKTYAISHLVPRLLLEGSVSSLEEILLVTFTNDAARELSDRTRKVLEKLHSEYSENESSPPGTDEGIRRLREHFPDERHRKIIAQALLDIDRLGVSTIHSFCQRVIQSEGTLCGLPVIPEIIAEPSDFLEEATRSLWQTRVANDPFLASIVSCMGWEPAEDQAAIRATMELDLFDTEPPSQPFEEILAHLASAPKEFEGAAIVELEKFSEGIESWNKAANDAGVRKKHFSALATSGNFAEWISAVRWVKSMGFPRGGLIPARGAKAHAAIEEAANLKAVRLSVKLDAMATRLHWDWQIHFASEVRSSVFAALRKNQNLTYHGLICAVRDALLDLKNGPRLAARLRQQFKVALIDESQDTDPIQFSIFQRIFLGEESDPVSKDQRLVLIGDPKQAIYEFRGADVNTYLDARRKAGPRVFTLTKTYRSPEPLVCSVNSLFRREESFLKPGLDFHPASSAVEGDRLLLSGEIDPASRLEAWIVPDEDAGLYSSKPRRVALIAETVASEILRILNSSAQIAKTDEQGKITETVPVQPGDFAVLVGNHFEAEEMIRALSERRIPAIRAKGRDIFGCDEAAELLIILKAISQPRSSKLRRAAMATRILGWTLESIQKLSDDPDQDSRLLERFVKWQNTFQHQGIAAVIAEIDREESVIPRLAAIREGERRIANFRQISDILQSASAQNKRRPESLIRWFGQEISRAQNRTEVDERQQQLESDRQAVQIATMHAAKGLEYNLVFCPFLWGAKNPFGIQKLARADEATLLIRTDLTENESLLQSIRRAALEDRLRLAYVAITRARIRVWIFGGECAGTKTPASALDWLFREETPGDLESWMDIAGSKGRGLRHLAGLEILNMQGANILVQSPPGVLYDEWESHSTDSHPLLQALPAPAIPSPWSVTSFSGLVREKHAHADSSPFSFSFENTKSSGLKILAVPTAGPMEFLHAPGGIRMGTAIHDWIEKSDFSDPDPAAIRKHLGGYFPSVPAGTDPQELAESTLSMLRNLGDAILPGLDCPVKQACSKALASEWQFHLPIRDSVDSSQLAEIFEKYAKGESIGYAPYLANLNAVELRGYLQGFLDRIAFREGKWGVIDWKTNVLGNTLSAYDPASLLACARQSHYLLQTHLYLLALRRWLPEQTEIAGAWLVFLRAVEADTSRGILHICPAPELLDALDHLFFKPEIPSLQ